MAEDALEIAKVVVAQQRCDHRHAGGVGEPTEGIESSEVLRAEVSNRLGAGMHDIEDLSARNRLPVPEQQLPPPPTHSASRPDGSWDSK